MSQRHIEDQIAATDINSIILVFGRCINFCAVWLDINPSFDNDKIIKCESC